MSCYIITSDVMSNHIAGREAKIKQLVISHTNNKCPLKKRDLVVW